MEELTRVVKKYYKEGNRFTIAMHLFGSMATSRIPIGTTRDFYNGIKNLDDEDRSSLIDRVYDRYQSKKRIKTLENFKNDVIFNEILLALNNVSCYKDDNDRYIEDYEIENAFASLDSDSINDIDLDSISYPISSHLTPMSYNYLKSRGIDEDDIEKWNIRSGTGEYTGRVVFPVYFNGKCPLVVGRSYVGHHLKYKYSKGRRNKFIWNYDNVKDKSSVIICEGIISAISAYKHSSINSVAVLGSSLSNDQKIMLSRFDDIILCFDPDVDDMKVYSIAESFNKDVRVMKLPDNTDPNDVTNNVFIGCLNNSKFINEFESMRMRIL